MASLSRTAACAWLCAFAALGCDAVLGGRLGGSGSGDLGPVLGPDGKPITGAPEACEPNVPQDLVLLGELPFVNALRDLFGADALEGRLAPDAYTKTFSQKGIVANTSLVNGRLDWAIHVTGALDGRVPEVTGCTEGDAVCARDYFARMARRIYRRPVEAVELDDLMEVYALGAETSFEEGIQLGLQALLVSPSANHRTEYGVAQEDGTFALTQHEFASTLSFLLTDSIPDEPLLRAADAGLLETAEQRDEHVTRLLELPATRESVEKTLMAAWLLGNLFGKVKDPGLYPEFSTALASQMYRETELFLGHHLWNEGLASVLTSRTSFVNGALAELYGIPFPGTDPNEFVEVTLPAGTRAGLLTQASVLSTFSRTDQTSVVARGLFVNGPLLCLPRIPPPPEEAIAEIEEQLTLDLSERERAEFRGATSPCRNCHDQFDAYGLLFETYDAIGKHRLEEDGTPIDPAVDLSKMDAFDGVFMSAVHFSEAVAARPDFPECVSRHLLSYGTGDDGMKRADCEVQNVAAEIGATSTLADVVRAVVRSPALSLRVAGAPPEETPAEEEDE